MSRKTKVILVAAAAPVLAGIAVIVTCAASYEARDWLKFRVYYGSYVAWKKNGGPIRSHFYEPLMLDRHRDSMVSGLSYEQILAKFPFLVDGDRYPPASYKGEYLREVRKESPEARVLWFRQEDEFDWCVYLDGSRKEIRLIKG